MASNYLECLAHTLREEGGEVQPLAGPPFVRGEFSFSDHPRDPGGRTMMGILQSEYDAFREGRGHPPGDVRSISDAELVDIYAINYWAPCRAENLPRGLDLAVFDFAVNSGVKTAVMKLQVALGVERIDGVIGVKTQKALANCDPSETVSRLMNERRRYCRQIKHYSVFAGGWEKRWVRIEAAALKMCGTIPSWEPILNEEVVTVTGRARAPDPPASMIQSDTGNMAVLGGGSGAVGVGTSLAKATAAVAAKGKVTFLSVISMAASREEFWFGVVALATGAYIWLERRRKMTRDNT